MQNNCQQFCGCQQYLQTQPINDKVYVSFFIILISMMIALRTGTQWFIYKDYYPLKQRSPLLCIVMIAFITMQIMLYPMLYIFNYFTKSFEKSQYLYRMFFYGLDGSIYFIYILRSLRLVYAHTTDPSRQNTRVFKLFKSQYILGLACVGLMIFRMLPIYFNPDNNTYQFYTIIQFSTFFSKQYQLPFLIKTIIIEFIWILSLIYCLKLQSLAHPKHSMKNQLMLIISVNILLSTLNWFMLLDQVGQKSLFVGLCNKYDDYPVVQIIRSFSLILMFAYTALYPLAKKKVYHMLLPTGRNYGLTKTMRDFLIQPQFLNIFTKFLQYLDEINQTTKYSGLLECWKKVMILKYCQKTQVQKLQQIRKLLTENSMFITTFQQPSSPRKRSQNYSSTSQGLLKSLLKSIQSLQQNQNLSEQIIIRYRLDVNQKVQEIQRKLLQRLDKIYKENYHETKSYFHLKVKLNYYKKVNVNMILMKMALMIEAEENQ